MAQGYRRGALLENLHCWCHSIQSIPYFLSPMVEHHMEPGFHADASTCKRSAYTRRVLLLAQATAVHHQPPTTKVLNHCLC
jgi:hypothetical protein